MAESDNTISLSKKSEKGNEDVLSEDLESALHIKYDFVWVENTNPQILQEIEEQNDKKQLEIINITTRVANVAPYESISESCSDTVLSQIKYSDEKKTDGEAVVASDLDKEFLVELKYWEQYESAAKKMNSIKLKCPTSQIRTLKKHKSIDITITIPRHLSYYQFGSATMDILERLQRNDFVGKYLNVAGRGLNSVVFYTPNRSVRRPLYPCGLAVKVYKLNYEVRKNSAVLKKAQRECDNLCTLKDHCLVPRCNGRIESVIVMEFIGFDEKTAPSINTLPLERCKEVYDILVNQLQYWYALHIVHGKLSGKYIRIYRDRPYVLGWSHSVRTEHPQAFKKLMRDCHFVTEFFKTRGVLVTSTEELFKSITGIEKLSRTLLDEIYGKNLWPDHHLTNPNRTSDDHCKPHSTSRFKAYSIN